MKSCKYITKDKECLESDYFARNLLVPTHKLKDLFLAMKIENIDIDFRLIGDYFGVTEYLIKLRLRDENMKEFKHLIN